MFSRTNGVHRTVAIRKFATDNTNPHADPEAIIPPNPTGDVHGIRTVTFGTPNH